MSIEYNRKYKYSLKQCRIGVFWIQIVFVDNSEKVSFWMGNNLMAGVIAFLLRMKKTFRQSISCRNAVWRLPWKKLRWVISMRENSLWRVSTIATIMKAIIPSGLLNFQNKEQIIWECTKWISGLFLVFKVTKLVWKALKSDFCLSLYYACKLPINRTFGHITRNCVFCTDRLKEITISYSKPSRNQRFRGFFFA